jgi:hypothetical protein
MEAKASYFAAAWVAASVPGAVVETLTTADSPARMRFS